MRPVFALLGLLLLASAPAAQAQRVPRFVGTFALPYVNCDCYAHALVFRTTEAVPGYAEPDASGRAVRTVAAGRLIEGNDWDEALTVVVTPGVAVALRDVTLTGARRYGAERYLGPDAGEGEEGATFTIRAGDRLEYLESDLGVEEGGAYVRHDGVVYGAAWPFDGRLRWEREEPVVAMWFHLIAKPGRPAAWVSLDWGGGAGRNATLLCGIDEPCPEGTGNG